MKRTILFSAALSIFGTGLATLPAWAVDVAAQPAPATQPAGDPSALIQKLGDEDFHVRQDAASRLRAMGNAAVPALREARKSQDPEIHAKAQELLEEIDRPPALPVPLPRATSNETTFSRRISVANGTKSVDATEPGRTVHIEEGKDGIAMKVTGQIEGKEVTREYKAKTADELKKDNPDAYALYQQYAQNGNLGQIQFQAGGGVIINGNVRLNVQGGGVVLQPGGVMIQPGQIQALPRPNLTGDNIEHLQDKIREQMKDAKLPDAQQDEVNGLLKQLRDSVDQPGAAADADAKMREYNRQCDALRKKLADLNLPDPGEALPPPASQRLGITAVEEKGVGDGLTVMHVLPDSRAEKIGLKELDTIQKVNGKEIHSAQDLRKAVTDNPKGLVLEGMRDGKAIKLEEKP